VKDQGIKQTAPNAVATRNPGNPGNPGGLGADAWLITHTDERLEKVLHRERARTDRSGNPFSLVVFTGPRNARNKALLEPVACAVEMRMRETDEMGWLDDHSIHTLLYDTDVNGAREFSDVICQCISEGQPKPTCTIYSYPPKNASQVGQVRADGIQRIDESSEESDRNLEILVSSLLAGLSVEHHQPDGEIQHTESPLTHPMPAWKRMMDIGCSTMALILLSPLLAVTAIVIKLTSSGPFIFRQQRSGLGGKPFTLYKFRTMCVDAEQQKPQLQQFSEQDGPAFKMKNDPRITSIGNLLRKTSIDEFPQFWNVLKGDMTMVGPRPLPCDETLASDQWHKKRLDVTPGLTCIWQIEGRSSVTFDEWVRMDVRYIRKRTFWHDLKLIFLTIPAMLWKRNGQ
jgi:lipopolysaccharide/colanic/teichoic acid biosynthesis glycosyltransferase